jgi:hypothetical protein
MTAEEAGVNLGKVIDHLKATQTPADGGAVEAAAEALRDLLSSNPALRQQVADSANAKLTAAKAPAAPKPTQNPAPAQPVQHDVSQENAQPQG